MSYQQTIRDVAQEEDLALQEGDPRRVEAFMRIPTDRNALDHLSRADFAREIALFLNSVDAEESAAGSSTREEWDRTADSLSL